MIFINPEHLKSFKNDNIENKTKFSFASRRNTTSLIVGKKILDSKEFAFHDVKRFIEVEYHGIFT